MNYSILFALEYQCFGRQNINPHTSFPLNETFSISVVDPDPQVFRPPGSGTISQRYGSGPSLFCKGVKRTEKMLAK